MKWWRQSDWYGQNFKTFLMSHINGVCEENSKCKIYFKEALFSEEWCMPSYRSDKRNALKTCNANIVEFYKPLYVACQQGVKAWLVLAKKVNKTYLSLQFIEWLVKSIDEHLFLIHIVVRLGQVLFQLFHLKHIRYFIPKGSKSWLVTAESSCLGNSNNSSFSEGLQFAST